MPLQRAACTQTRNLPGVEPPIRTILKANVRACALLQRYAPKKLVDIVARIASEAAKDYENIVDVKFFYNFETAISQDNHLLFSS